MRTFLLPKSGNKFDARIMRRTAGHVAEFSGCGGAMRG